jgi:hypothetical protein
MFCTPAGNNLEAGLGALVTKRLVDAHLRAKQRAAERMQRELEVRLLAPSVHVLGRALRCALVVPWSRPGRAPGTAWPVATV